MALRKMQDPRVNLKAENKNTEKDKILDSREGHKKKFEERIKRIEKKEQEAKKEKYFDELKEKKRIKRAETDTRPETEMIRKSKQTATIIKNEKKAGKKQAVEDNQVEPIIQTEKKDSLNIQKPTEASPKLKFPKGFLWGTSSSSYQVEGGNVNDWSLWEKGGKRMLQIMKEGKDPDGFICGKACDSYNRYEEDFKLARGLNNNATRIGIEWSRVEKQKDIWNVDEIKHYREMLRSAKKNKLDTVVTLWHWTLPAWLANEGGLTSKNFVKRFERYVEMVIGELGGDIDYWVTLNEPMIVTLNGYISKRWPPNKRSVFKFFRACRNLVKAHKSAYNMIHSRFPDARVGFSNLTNFIEPKHRWFLPELVLVWIFEYKWNKWFINKTKEHVDYIGMSYYFHDRIIALPPFVSNEELKTTDMGWEIYPEGIYHVLKQLSKYNKPIMILENGLADEADRYRADFIKEHLHYVQKAIGEGVEVLGYFHWSLLDNFEWDSGYRPKFGLYAVDRKTFERTARPSAAVYARICKENAVDA